MVDEVVEVVNVRMKEEWKVDGSSFVGWERDGKWKLSLMMAHYLRHNHQATANRALSTSFPGSFPFLSLSFPFLSFPSLACPCCSLPFPSIAIPPISILTSHVLSLV